MTCQVKAETAYERGGTTWTLVPKTHVSECTRVMPYFISRGYGSLTSTRVAICRSCGVAAESLNEMLDGSLKLRAKQAKIKSDELAAEALLAEQSHERQRKLAAYDSLRSALAGLVEAVKADDMSEQAQVDLHVALAAAEEALRE